MKHELWYSVVVRDRSGKVISRKRGKSKSYLNAWNKLVYVQMSQVNATIKDTGGTDRSVNVHGDTFAMYAAAAVTTYGIRVGTGNTAVTINDYALETLIAEGAGAGQMNHLATSVDVSVVSAPHCYFLVSRTIVNNSGGLITCRESGIYARAASFYACVVRDVFGAAQDVPDGGSIIINYTLRVTV